LEALRAGTPLRKVLIARGVLKAESLDEIRVEALEAGVKVDLQDRRVLDRMSGGRNHQGVVAEAEAYDYADVDDLLERPTARLVLLDGVTDPSNLGSILRSMDAFGWSGVLTPKRRSVGVTPAVRKVAAGAADRIPVAQVGSPADSVSRLKEAGYLVAGLDPAGSIDYTDELLTAERFCLVVGAEGKGLSELVKKRCDLLVRINMRGALASLNVGVAAAVVMAEIARKSADKDS
ncbi:MAG TPA: 23S rRNA (guanosine(2251)-2'-O)-methyltransferase RlmB, partial [Actinomycetota bacterium]|nr:23S rRNA (guanosine(2251)-2'-O)-methyltransferase RlmB [Actinomycetota bacterium]